ncbi:MAG: biopolymer transporter TolR, partial [bacterium]
MATSLFNNNQDIGDITLPGRIHFDPENDIYSVTGGGKNMWLTADAFHFAWTQVSGDVSLTANITFPEVGKNPHRKACLIIRQDLTAGSAYADAALHGDGLTSLQFRNEKDGTTHEVQANVSGPKRLRLEKRGAYVLM